MGLMDKIKGMFKGKGAQVNQGIDKAADAVQSKTPDSVDKHVETASEKAKEIVDKIDGP